MIRGSGQRLPATPQGTEHARYVYGTRLLPSTPLSPIHARPSVMEVGALLPGDKRANGRSTAPTFLTVQIRICPVHSSVAINNHCTDAEPRFR